MPFQGKLDIFHSVAAAQVRLVVIDSITFHFRQEQQDVGERTRMLAAIGQSLMALAGRNNLAVRRFRPS